MMLVVMFTLGVFKRQRLRVFESYEESLYFVEFETGYFINQVVFDGLGQRITYVQICKTVIEIGHTDEES